MYIQLYQPCSSSCTSMQTYEYGSYMYRDLHKEYRRQRQMCIRDRPSTHLCLSFGRLCRAEPSNLPRKGFVKAPAKRSTRGVRRSPGTVLVQL